MREYQLAKQHMAQQVQYAEHTRLLKGTSQPLHKQLMAFLHQRSTTQSDRKPMTATQQFKATTIQS